MHSSIQMKLYNLQKYIRPLEIKYSFVCSNFVLFRIIPIAEVYSESSRTCKMKLFAKKLTVSSC